MNVRLNRRLIVRDGLVAVRDLAEAIDADGSNLHRRLKRLGIPIDKKRCHEARGQYVSVITRADAERFLAKIRGEFLGSGGEVAYIELDQGS